METLHKLIAFEGWMQNVIWDWTCTYSDRRQSEGGEKKAQKNPKVKEQNAFSINVWAREN